MKQPKPTRLRPEQNPDRKFAGPVGEWVPPNANDVKATLIRDGDLIYDGPSPHIKFLFADDVYTIIVLHGDTVIARYNRMFWEHADFVKIRDEIRVLAEAHDKGALEETLTDKVRLLTQEVTHLTIQLEATKADHADHLAWCTAARNRHDEIDNENARALAARDSQAAEHTMHVAKLNERISQLEADAVARDTTLRSLAETVVDPLLAEQRRLGCAPVQTCLHLGGAYLVAGGARCYWCSTMMNPRDTFRLTLHGKPKWSLGSKEGASRSFPPNERFEPGSPRHTAFVENVIGMINTTPLYPAIQDDHVTFFGLPLEEAATRLNLSEAFQARVRAAHLGLDMAVDTAIGSDETVVTTYAARDEEDERP